MKKLIACIALLGVIRTASAQNYQWVTKIDNQGTSVFTTDNAHNIYNAGAFYGTVDFDPGAGVFNLTSTGSVQQQQADIFIAKYDSAGNFIWAKSMGGDGYEAAHNICVDNVGNVYVIGEFQQSTIDFDPGPGTAILTTTLPTTFILKLDASGNFVWVKQLNIRTGLAGSYGATPQKIMEIDDATNSLYITGSFAGEVDFDPNAGVFNLNAPIISGYGMNGFLLTLDTDGNFMWVKQFGGTATSNNKIRVSPDKIALDAQGNIHLAGVFTGTADFDPGQGTSTLSSVYTDQFGAPFTDAFVCKLTPNGDFIWAKPIIGKHFDGSFMNMTIDVSGNIYLTGGIDDTTDFDPGPDEYNLIPNWLWDPGLGKFDIFLSKWDPDGNFVWVKQILSPSGGFGSGYGYGIDFDETGNVYFSGRFFGIDTLDFDPGPDEYKISSNAALGTAFLEKLDENGNFIWVKPIGTITSWNGNPQPISSASYINISDTGTIYVCGMFRGSSNFDFDPGPGQALLQSTIGSAFILKLGNTDTSTNISDINAPNLIGIYPNPANETITIGNVPENSTVIITTLAGSILYNRKASKETLTVDVSTFSSGVYVVQVENRKMVSTQKLIIN